MANGIFERQGVVFVDGYGYAGRCMSFTVPVVEEVMQEHVAGGYGGTVEIPMGRVASMESTMTLKTHDRQLHKAMSKPDVSIKYRASAVDDDGTEHSIRYELRGRLSRWEEAEKTPEGEHTVSLRMHVTSFAKFVDDEEVFFIDIKALVYRPDGSDDVWENLRKSLGL